MEKYGFVYIWFDVYRKMYYIGSHWGTITDGYVCSSNRMRDAYRRRPNDFKRRILISGVDNRKLLLEIENAWLLKIKDEELGKKYYNMTKYMNGHWSTDKQRYLTSKEKMKSNHRTKKGITNKGIKYKPQKDSSPNRLKGDERNESQKTAAKLHSDRIKGRKWYNNGVECKMVLPELAPEGWIFGRLGVAEKISKARKGKKTGMIPKSAFQKGQAPWNKGLKLKGEI